MVRRSETSPELPEPHGQGIRFEGVRFAYPSGNLPALDGVDLEIQAGELLAIVGGNGSGKSTLVKLLLRFYDPDEGTIRLDGVDILDLDPEDVRRRMGVLFQDFLIYDFTIRENITFGRIDDRYERGDIEKAIKAAQADSIIDKIADGIDANLGHLAENARPLSGGEMQRLGLARLIFRNADIWILDEPTSALDVEAEEAVFAEVRRMLTGRTGIIISHRFSTVRLADRIAVMDSGRVVEMGTHSELMARSGRYAELFELQASRYR